MKKIDLPCDETYLEYTISLISESYDNPFIHNLIFFIIDLITPAHSIDMVNYLTYIIFNLFSQSYYDDLSLIEQDFYHEMLSIVQKRSILYLPETNIALFKEFIGIVNDECDVNALITLITCFLSHDTFLEISHLSEINEIISTILPEIKENISFLKPICLLTNALICEDKEYFWNVENIISFLLEFINHEETLPIILNTLVNIVKTQLNQELLASLFHLFLELDIEPHSSLLNDYISIMKIIVVKKASMNFDLPGLDIFFSIIQQKYFSILENTDEYSTIIYHIGILILHIMFLLNDDYIYDVINEFLNSNIFLFSAALKIISKLNLYYTFPFMEINTSIENFLLEMSSNDCQLPVSVINSIFQFKYSLIEYYPELRSTSCIENCYTIVDGIQKATKFYYQSLLLLQPNFCIIEDIQDDIQYADDALLIMDLIIFYISHNSNDSIDKINEICCNLMNIYKTRLVKRKFYQKLFNFLHLVFLKYPEQFSIKDFKEFLLTLENNHILFNNEENKNIINDMS